MYWRLHKSGDIADTTLPLFPRQLARGSKINLATATSTRPAPKVTPPVRVCCLFMLGSSVPYFFCIPIYRAKDGTYVTRAIGCFVLSTYVAPLAFWGVIL